MNISLLNEDDDNDDLPPSYSMLDLCPDGQDGLPAFADILVQTEAGKSRLRKTSSEEKEETCLMRRVKFERQMKLFRSLDS